MSIFLGIVKQLVSGLAVGYAIGLTGIGAGVLVIPVLTQVVGLDPVASVGTGFLYQLLTKFYAVIEHLRLGTVRRRTALYFILGSAPAVAGTSLMVNLMAAGRTREGLETVVTAVIAAVLIITWFFLLFELVRSRRKARDYYIPPKVFPIRRKVWGGVLGFLVGLLLGPTSVGGGVLVIPILLAFFTLSPRDTVGTTNLISLVLAVVGSAFYFWGGNVVPNVAAIMFVGSIPGVLLGSRSAAQMPHWLVNLVLLTLVALGTFLILVKFL